MSIYWSYKSLPELQALPAAERWEVWKKAIFEAYGHWQTWLVFPIAYILVFPVSSWLGSTYGHEFIGTTIGLLIASVISERIVFRITRSYLKTIVTHADKD